jgi:hypothetical protein
MEKFKARLITSSQWTNMGSSLELLQQAIKEVRLPTTSLFSITTLMLMAVLQVLLLDKEFSLLDM